MFYTGFHCSLCKYAMWVGEGNIDQYHSVSNDWCYEGERDYMEEWWKRQREGHKVGHPYKLGGATSLVDEFVLNHIQIAISKTFDDTSNMSSKAFMNLYIYF